MKICGFTCIFAAIIVVSMIIMTLFMTGNETMVKYEKQLPPELRKKYYDIVKERRTIYYTGYALGFGLAFLLIAYNVYFLNKPYFNTTSMVCLSIVIAFITNHMYYTLIPKSDMMLNHISDPLQTKAWLEMYKHMQYYFHLSFILGIIGVGLFASSFRCNKYLLS